MPVANVVFRLTTPGEKRMGAASFSGRNNPAASNAANQPSTHWLSSAANNCNISPAELSAKMAARSFFACSI